MRVFLIEFLESTPISYLVVNYTWTWPIAEIVHFMGLSLLIGAIGILDMRMLGLAKGLKPEAVHRLVPIGILGFLMNFCSGLIFLGADPVRFLSNPLFEIKMLLILIAGINALAFYVLVYRDAQAMQAGDGAPLAGKLIASISLILWLAVIVVGRMMPWV